MKMYWWQGGLHLESESTEEGKAIDFFISNLKFTKFEDEVPAGPVGAIERNDQKAVVAI